MFDHYMNSAHRSKLTRQLVPAIVGAWLLLLSISSPALADPGIPDSVMIQSATFNKGTPVSLNVWTSNDEWLTGIEITLTWPWDSLLVDSFRFAPGRLPASTVAGSTPNGNSIVIFAFPAGDNLISPGNTHLGTLYFNYPDSASERTITIDTTTLFLSDSLIEHSTTFTDTIWPQPFTPQYRSGDLTLVVCCTGLSGNTDCDIDQRINLADITRLIDRVYIGKQPLCCEASGNVDGDLDRRINLADITRLIDRVYISKNDTAPCF